MNERVSVHVKGELEGKALHPIIAEIMDSHFDAGYRQAWFAHEPWHLWYILEGEALVGIDGTETVATSGDMFLIPGGVLHSLAVPGTGPCRVFDAKFGFDRRDCVTRLPRTGHLRDEFGVRHLIKRILREIDRKAPAWETAVRGLFNEIVSEVVRRCSLPESQPPWPGAVRQSVAFIERNYMNPISLDDVANTVAFSPKYLANLFKQVTGYTVNEYITHVRIERAKWYLAHTDLPIKEISDRVGYASIYYFSRVFRERVGVPASVYRRNHRV